MTISEKLEKMKEELKNEYEVKRQEKLDADVEELTDIIISGLKEAYLDAPYIGIYKFEMERIRIMDNGVEYEISIFQKEGPRRGELLIESFDKTIEEFKDSGIVDVKIEERNGVSEYPAELYTFTLDLNK